MRILSNNVWKCDANVADWKAQGMDCSAAARAPSLVRAYREIDADVMALQEVSRTMEALLMEALRPLGHELVTGGDTPIVFRHDRLKLLESGFLRFDESVPGLVGCFNNEETKSCSWTVFETRGEEKRRLAVMSAHLWYKAESRQPGSDAARTFQFRIAAARLAEAMARHHCPGILAGDLNAAMESPCLKAAVADGWMDVHDLADEADETSGRHPCGFNGYSRLQPFPPFSEAIDHIMLKGAEEIKVERFRRLTDEWFDPISDHYPLWCEIALQKCSSRCATRVAV